MLRSPTPQRQRPHVTVHFGDGAHSFTLPKDATLHELADRVHVLRVHHVGAPIEIYVAFSNKHSMSTTTQSPRPHVGF